VRPLELSLTGFRSYDEETVDWRGHGLVVIAGDTGAGKTSLLDAICFALYGRTPELSGPRELLGLGRAHGEVRLTFARGQEVWRATRRFGPEAPEPLHLLERLEGDTDAVAEAMAGEAVVSDRLRELVGLRFEAFTSAVILAQGRFARFLGARPRDRDDILRELFGVASLEGARAAAQAAAAEASRAADALAGQRAGLPPHGPAERARAGAAARAAAARAAAVAALAPAAAAAEAARAEAAGADAEAARIRRAAADVPDGDARAAISARLAEAGAAGERADAALAEAARAASEAAARRAEGRARHGGTAAELAGLRGDAARLGELEDALPRQEAELERRRREVRAVVAALEGRAALVSRAELAEAAAAAEGARAGAEAALAEAASRLASAAAARAAAEAAAEGARAGAEAARRAHLAADLRAALAPGDPCPVCGAAVGDGPPGGAPPELGDAREAADAARRAAGEAATAEARAGAEEAAARAGADAAREAEAAARAAQAGAGGAPGDDPAALRREAGPLARDAAAAQAAGGELTALAAALEAARAEAAALRARLGAWGDAGAAARLDAAVAELGALDAAAERALGEEAAARRGADAARVAREEIERAEVAPLRQAAVLLAQRLGARAPAPSLDARGAVAAAGRLAARAARAVDALGSRAARARERAAAAEGLIAREGPAVGVSAPGDLPGAAAAARARVGEARAALAAVEATAAEGRRLAALERDARAAAARHGRVAADLQANRFPRYLLQRYRERLAVGASARLEELSGRRYRFAGTGADPLDVIDLARGERRRSAATLSGGERFLASLALALGLGEAAAESGGRLDCLFLDEGFSSLDAESLEQALSGVERLAADGRLVVVITHVPGVVDRLGAAIRVAKDPGGVSRVAA
jgi:exonuclease SbcC